jgi:glucan phosphoethanolaminetransferase (alkaline phosphatase superfamily)
MTKRRVIADVIESYIGLKPFIYGSCFFVLLVVFELLFLRDADALAILSKHLSSGSYGRAITVLLLSTVSLVLTWLFIVLAFASRPVTRLIYFAIFAACIIVEYSHYRAFGFFSDYAFAEIAIFAIDGRFVRDAAGMYFSYLAIIPVIGFGLLLWRLKPGRRHFGALALILLLFIAQFLATSYFTRNSFYVPSLASAFRTTVSFPVIWFVGTARDPARRTSYYGTRESLSFKSDSVPKNNIIFIVDESVRADFVETRTTLGMLNDSGYVHDWGNAVSSTTCSLSSNLMLLSGSSTAPDPELKVYAMPTIYQYAKAMNYRTLYVDGQVAFVWNGKPADLQYIDGRIREHQLRAEVANDHDIDARIGTVVREIVENSTGNFIWISKRGVHPPYEDDLPTEDAASAAGETLREKYARAVRYNSRIFFDALLGRSLPRAGNYYLYTSDHGQTLAENGAASHCVASSAAATVPLFLIADPSSIPPVDLGFRASHSNIFATLLDLMSVPSAARSYDYPVSLFDARQADSRQRYFFSGDLQGRFEGTVQPYDEALLGL